MMREMMRVAKCATFGKRACIRSGSLPPGNRPQTMTSDDLSCGLTGLLHTTVAELVRSDGRDLSMRQLGIFLTCYLEAEAQTVRGLAAKLRIQKPTVTRALDRLEEFGLTRRN